jgi:hypothetical protein
MRIARYAIPLALIAASPSHATLLMFQWTPERILLAADSLSAKVHQSGQVDTVTECKIHQQGNFFFALAGINDDPGANVDLVSLAARAAASSGNLRGVMHSFEGSVAGPVRALWSDMVQHRAAAARLALATDGRMTITVIFVARREQAIAVKEYDGGFDGAVTETPAWFYGSGSGMRQDRGYVAVGVYGDAQAASANNRIAGEGVPFINSFYEVQIAHELQRARQSATPRIGGPVCILEVMTGTASWAGGEQGACGAIRP